MGECPAVAVAGDEASRGEADEDIAEGLVAHVKGGTEVGAGHQLGAGGESAKHDGVEAAAGARWRRGRRGGGVRSTLGGGVLASARWGACASSTTRLMVIAGGAGAARCSTVSTMPSRWRRR